MPDRTILIHAVGPIWKKAARELGKKEPNQQKFVRGLLQGLVGQLAKRGGFPGASEFVVTLTDVNHGAISPDMALERFEQVVRLTGSHPHAYAEQRAAKAILADLRSNEGFLQDIERSFLEECLSEIVDQFFLGMTRNELLRREFKSVTEWHKWKVDIWGEVKGDQYYKSLVDQVGSDLPSSNLKAPPDIRTHKTPTEQSLNEFLPEMGEGEDEFEGGFNHDY